MILAKTISFNLSLKSEFQSWIPLGLLSGFPLNRRNFPNSFFHRCPSSPLKKSRQNTFKSPPKVPKQVCHLIDKLLQKTGVRVRYLSLLFQNGSSLKFTFRWWTFLLSRVPEVLYCFQPMPPLSNRFFNDDSTKSDNQPTFLCQVSTGCVNLQKWKFCCCEDPMWLGCCFAQKQ